MLCKDNLISVLNTETSKAQTITIQDMYNLLIEKAEPLSSGQHIIDVKPYMIRDGGGYTEITELMRFESTPFDAFYEINANGNSVYLTKDSQIIVFDTTEEPTIGFHGMRTYKKKFKTLGSYVYNNKFKFQVYRLSKRNPLMENFEMALISAYDYDGYMYGICTKSHSYNCNEILMQDDSSMRASLNMMSMI